MTSEFNETIGLEYVAGIEDTIHSKEVELTSDLTEQLWYPRSLAGAGILDHKGFGMSKGSSVGLWYIGVVEACPCRVLAIEAHFCVLLTFCLDCSLDCFSIHLTPLFSSSSHFSSFPSAR